MQNSTSKAVSQKRPAKQHAEREVNASAPIEESASSTDVVGRAFQKYNESLVRYLSVRLCSRRDAEEVAQEAYARMLKLDESDTISHMQAYLFKIASNIAIDRMRSQGRQPQHLSFDGVSDGLPAPAVSVDTIVGAREQLSLIMKIVAELPPKCRKAFLLYKFKELSYSEIAEQMQLTESMIRKYVLRAIAYCRSRLDNENLGGQ